MAILSTSIAQEAFLKNGAKISGLFLQIDWPSLENSWKSEKLMYFCTTTITQTTTDLSSQVRKDSHEKVPKMYVLENNYGSGCIICKFAEMTDKLQNVFRYVPLLCIILACS